MNTGWLISFVAGAMCGAVAMGLFLAKLRRICIEVCELTKELERKSERNVQEANNILLKAISHYQEISNRLPNLPDEFHGNDPADWWKKP